MTALQFDLENEIRRNRTLKKKTKRKKNRKKRTRRRKTKRNRKKNRKKRTRLREKRYKKGNQYGGTGRKLDIDNDIVTYQTLGDCIKELIDVSYKIYKDLLYLNQKITIVCGGQSPAYYCLAMMNFQIFNPGLVNIVILPHSKGQQESKDQSNENIEYCNRLKEKNIKLHTKVVIIDGVHSGTGILALESALNYCFPGTDVTKIAINAHTGTAQIPVDEEIILPCQPKFSDVYPRLVASFYPREFSDSSKFITDFDLNNPVAEMIIDVAKDYPEIKVENTDWYNLNNEITKEIAEKKAIQQRQKQQLKQRQKQQLKQQQKQRQKQRQKEQEEEELKKNGDYFNPIVLESPKRYQCPVCESVSGPSLIIVHNWDCPNKFKEAVVLATGCTIA
jgi:hypothetical protein